MDLPPIAVAELPQIPEDDSVAVGEVPASEIVDLPGLPDEETTTEQRATADTVDLPGLPDDEVEATGAVYVAPSELPDLPDTEAASQQRAAIEVPELPSLPEDEIQAEDSRRTAESVELPELPEEPAPVQFLFEGKWLPDLAAVEIGADNFSVMQNLKYSDSGPVGVAGYTKRTSSTAPFVT